MVGSLSFILQQEVMHGRLAVRLAESYSSQAKVMSFPLQVMMEALESLMRVTEHF